MPLLDAMSTEELVELIKHLSKLDHPSLTTSLMEYCQKELDRRYGRDSREPI